MDIQFFYCLLNYLTLTAFKWSTFIVHLFLQCIYVFIFRVPFTIGVFSAAGVVLVVSVFSIPGPFGSDFCSLVTSSSCIKPAMICPHWFGQDVWVQVLHLLEHFDHWSALVQHFLYHHLKVSSWIVPRLKRVVVASSSSSVPVVSAPCVISGWVVSPCSNTRSGRVCSFGTPVNLFLVFFGDGTAGNVHAFFVLGKVLGSVGVACFCAACLGAEGLPWGRCVFFRLRFRLTGVSSSNPSLRVR